MPRKMTREELEKLDLLSYYLTKLDELDISGLSKVVQEKMEQLKTANTGCQDGLKKIKGQLARLDDLEKTAQTLQGFERNPKSGKHKFGSFGLFGAKTRDDYVGKTAHEITIDKWDKEYDQVINEVSYFVGTAIDQLNDASQTPPDLVIKLSMLVYCAPKVVWTSENREDVPRRFTKYLRPNIITRILTQIKDLFVGIYNRISEFLGRKEVSEGNLEVGTSARESDQLSTTAAATAQGVSQRGGHSSKQNAARGQGPEQGKEGQQFQTKPLVLVQRMNSSGLGYMFLASFLEEGL